MPLRFPSDAELARLSSRPDEVADDDLVTFAIFDLAELHFSPRIRESAAYSSTCGSRPGEDMG